MCKGQCQRKCSAPCKEEKTTEINNFDLHEQAMVMSSYLTSYSLARTVIVQRQEIEFLKKQVEDKQT